MITDATRRARWVENSPSTLILKCCHKDGGDVLATIEHGRYLGVYWDANGQSGGGFYTTIAQAKRRARKALR